MLDSTQETYLTLYQTKKFPCIHGCYMLKDAWLCLPLQIVQPFCRKISKPDISKNIDLKLKENCHLKHTQKNKAHREHLKHQHMQLVQKH